MSAAAVNIISAFGNIDIKLTGRLESRQPKLSYWRYKHKLFHRFALDQAEQAISGNADFSKTVTIDVDRSADLIRGVHTQIVLPALTTANVTSSALIGWVNSVGNQLIDWATFGTNNGVIDKIYGEYLELYSELFEKKDNGFNELVGKYGTDDRIAVVAGNASAARTYITPLRFYFEHPGLAVPVVALERTKVKFQIKFQEAVKCIKTDNSATSLAVTPTFTSAKFFIDYVSLDENERRNLYEQPHVYFVHTLQQLESSTFTWTTSAAASYDSTKLDSFTLAHTEYIWVPSLNVYRESNTGTGNYLFKYSYGFGSAETELLSDHRIKIHNKELIDNDSLTFRVHIPYKHHYKTPQRFIYNYCFAQFPESIQPSGHINHSILSSVFLETKRAAILTGSEEGTVRIYGRALQEVEAVEGILTTGFA
ncbi:MAG: hypothetical protein N2B06_16855 [Clostridium sp.]